MLRDLAAAGSRLPRDDWILGQRVRYLVEHGRADLAVVVTRGCRGTRWWCDGIEGFARHAGGDYEGADRAFDRGLGGMPAEQRCAWTDLSPLLGKSFEPYGESSCAGRAALNQRIWWLAQPLLSRTGNDLRTEHYARHMMVLLLEHAESPYGLPWGDDMRELLVRFGWATHWSRGPGGPSSLEPASVIGHEPGPSFWLFPTPALTEPWSDATLVQWDPVMERPPARYAPPYATDFAAIDRVQLARFRRGDSTLTMAAFDLRPDSALVSHPADVRLAVARDPATPVVVGRASPSVPRGVVAVRSGWRPVVVSLEAIGRNTGRVARRRALTPPDPAGLPPALSDVLLFAPGDVLPQSLEEAGAAALRAPAVGVGQRVGLYWERYGAAGAEPVQIEVTVTRTRSRRDAPYALGRPVCPYRVAPAVTVRWQETSATRPPGIARSIALDLRSLPRGRYEVAVQLTVAGKQRGCSSRELQIVAAGASVQARASAVRYFPPRPIRRH